MSAKTPSKKLSVLYVSTAGRSVVQVVPEGGRITIGNQTWKVTRNNLVPGKGTGKTGRWDVMCVEGQTEAVPVWASTPLTSIEFDAAAHNNLLEQINALARGGRPNAINWIQVAISGLLVIGLVGFGVVLHGDLGDLQKSVDQVNSKLDAQCPPPCSDTTVVGGGATSPRPQAGAGR